MKPEIEYLPDERVDDALDLEIRGLLTSCFTKPQDVVFNDRRYFREPYPHRWVIRDSHGALIAHIGVHEKHVEIEGSKFRIGGICEVCVHPDHRGKGYVRRMLKLIHEWLSERGFVFTILFGDPLVYGSSGYVQVANLFNGGDAEGWRQAKGLMNELSGTQWPSGKVLMPGPGF
jgi:predicted N-acetyltransferase YhbS